ncbi:MAG: Ig-like domain-containing protein [Deltaproteobacteria bacterium]|nr:Ig-like domain-containing protein [Deltaproteobacteria bacterium]
MRSTVVIAGMLLGGASSGCAGSDASIDLELVPDPNLNTTEQILSRIASLVVVLDAPEGLYPPGSERTIEGVQIRNADADPDLELVSVVPLPSGRLPRVRVERGALSARPLDLRVLGLDGPSGGTVAQGVVRGVEISDGDPREVAIPFNVLPRYLPPRVTDVSPADGEAVPGCSVKTVILVFSKPMDPASLWAPDRVRLEPAATSTRVEVEGRIVRVVMPEGIPSLRYALTVSAEARDTSGLGLDQDPMTAGDQGYQGTFDLRCEGNLDPPWCVGPPGPPVAYCPGPASRLSCIDGRCVLDRCTEVSCPPSTVCDPSTAACEVDCRLYGDDAGCPTPRRCRSTTGICEAR